MRFWSCEVGSISTPGFQPKQGPPVEPIGRTKTATEKPSEVVTSVMISIEDFVSMRKIQSGLIILTRALRERIAAGRAKP
jgi:hypothetical protein